MEKYVILGRIGEGAHGIVFKAKSIETGALVALKKVALRRLEDGIPNTALREIKALQEIAESPFIVHLREVNLFPPPPPPPFSFSRKRMKPLWVLPALDFSFRPQVFPHGTGFVLVFDYMLSDLSEVVRDAERPLTEAQIKSYVLMLLKGVAYCHEIGKGKGKAKAS